MATNNTYSNPYHATMISSNISTVMVNPLIPLYGNQPVYETPACPRGTSVYAGLLDILIRMVRAHDCEAQIIESTDCELGLQWEIEIRPQSRLRRNDESARVDFGVLVKMITSDKLEELSQYIAVTCATLPMKTEADIAAETPGMQQAYQQALMQQQAMQQASTKSLQSGFATAGMAQALGPTLRKVFSKAYK